MNYLSVIATKKLHLANLRVNRPLVAKPVQSLQKNWMRRRRAIRSKNWILQKLIRINLHHLNSLLRANLKHLFRLPILNIQRMINSKHP